MENTSDPLFFPSAEAFRAWLQKHHRKADELIVGFWKRASGEPTMTWSESVDQALCFGWIDGIRRGVDGKRYTIRFTPRRPGSIWSRINIDKVAALEAAGLMQPAGRKAFEGRTAAKSRIYTYEHRKGITLEPELQKRLESQKKAWAFCQAQPAGYRHLAIFHVMSARQPETRLRRLDRLIGFWSNGKRDR